MKILNRKRSLVALFAALGVCAFLFAAPLLSCLELPLCSIETASAQDNPCLAQEVTISAQQAEILRLQGTMAAQEVRYLELQGTYAAGVWNGFLTPPTAQPPEVIFVTVQILITPTGQPTQTLWIVTATPSPPLIAEAESAASAVATQSTLPTLDPALLSVDPGLQATAQALPPGCILHTLQAGDFPGLIAQQYGIDVADLFRVNNLTEENAAFLQIGQALIIPLPGCSLLGEEVTLPPTAASAQVIIRAVQNAGDVTAEQVAIRNTGATVNLNGWTLRDTDGNVYTFSEKFLFSNAELVVFTGVGTATPVAAYWGRNEAVWSPGDSVILSDPEGQAQSVWTIR